MKKITLFLFFMMLNVTVSFAATVDTLLIASKSMNKSYKAAIVLPNNYSKSKNNYPVLYLLHGAYGHFDNWLQSTPNPNLVKNLSDLYDIIVVMPEGETFSFYINSPLNRASQFETYISQEVIQKIDASYRTISNKNGRVISGLSMGGHGALYLATKHPDLFCAAGSMSGVVDMTIMISPERIERTKSLFEPILGKEVTNPEAYKPYTIMDQIEKIKNNKIPLIIDCGVDDFLYEINKEFHRRLLYNKIPHDYIERPGAHTWEYWENALPYQMLFFNNILNKK